MPRRSLRISEKASTTSSTLDPATSGKPPAGSVAANSSQPTGNKKASRKRSRAERLPTKRRKTTLDDLEEDPSHEQGKRALLEDIPLDIVFEIFSYLDSGDLHTLSRSTRDFRDILKDKSAEFAWRRAHANWDKPPPTVPEGMDEFSYAELLFGVHCYICGRQGKGKDGCESPLWTFQMRCCRACAHSTFPLFHVLKRKQPEQYRDEDILPREVLERQYTLEGTIPRCQLGNTAMTERLKEEFDALKTEDRVPWIIAMRQRRKTIFEYAGKCNDWYLTMSRIRRQRMLERRSTAIVKNLKELGLQEEIDKMNRHSLQDLVQFKSVDHTKVLTDQEWQSLEPELVRYISEYKSRRLKLEKEALVTQRCFNLGKALDQILANADHRNPLPGHGDILNDPSFQDLVIDTPAEDGTLTEDFFKSRLAEFLPKFLEHWVPNKVQEMLAVLQKAIPTATVSDLHLATSTFTCTSCCQPMVFPEMFHHRCCFRWSCQKPQARLAFYTERLSLSPWICCVEYSPTGSEFVKEVAEACGMDPLTVTTQDIHAANPLVECLCVFHHSRRHGRKFMRWPGALWHRQNPHLTDRHCKRGFVVNAFGEDTQTFMKLERSYARRHRIRCTHCNKSISGEHTSLETHLKESHNLDLGSDEGIYAEQSLESLQQHWYWNPKLRAMTYDDLTFNWFGK